MLVDAAGNKLQKYNKRRVSKLKKRLCVVLALLLMVLMVVSCNQSQPGTTDPDTTPDPKTNGEVESTADPTDPPSNLNDLGQLPLVKEEVELSMMLGYYPFLVEDIETHYAINEIQKRTGIKLDIELVDYQQASERLTLMLNADEELPDIVTACRISSQLISLYGSKGVFEALNDRIANDSFWIKQRFAEYEGLENQCRSWDGNIYMVPRYSENILSMYGPKLWINQTWLDNLNLEMPTTTEEFYNVMKAFKENDANNNGDPNDEIPLTTANDLYFGAVGGPLMNPWVYDDTGKQLIIENGKIVPAYTKPEWRQGLAYINRLYSEGLLDSECYTQDTNTMKQLFISDEITAGCVFAAKTTNIIPAANEDIWSQFVLVPPLKGETNETVTGFTPATIRSDTASLISGKSEHKDVAFRLLDYFWSEECRLITCYGEENVDWKTPDTGVKGVNGEDGFLEIINSFGSPELANRILGDNFTYFEPEKFIGGQLLKEGDADQYFYQQVTEKLIGYEPKEIVPPLMPIDPDSLDQYNELSTNILTFVNEMKAKFIIGEYDVNSDDDWNDYINTLDQYGLQEYLDILNKSYEQYKKH